MPEVRFFRDRYGHNIAYSMHGSGPLVLCPAWWVSHVEKDWEHESFRQFFELLSEGLTLVRYDRFGVGLSDAALLPHSLETEANVLADLVREIGSASYSLFALSCGGPVALAHAATYPDEVERLCCFGAYANGKDIGTPEVQDALCGVVNAHWGLGSRALADIFLPEETADVVNVLAKQQRDSASTDIAKALLRLTYSMDASSYVDDVKAETLVLHRRGDRAVPYTLGRDLASGIKNARLVTLEGRVHLPWVDGNEIARLANSFFRGEEVKKTVPQEASESGCRLDEKNRCLVVGADRIQLTPLEFGVLSLLISKPDQVITRDYLLEHVWKQPYEGSNRIDVLMRSLRKKLGEYAVSIETVIGHGYRFSDWKKG